MTADDLKAQGLRLYQAEKFAEAAQAFAQAAHLLAEAGQAVPSAEMRNNAGVAYMAQKNWPQALEVLQGTPEIFRAHGAAQREAEALANLAAAHEGVGDVAQAMQEYLDAIDKLNAVGERDTRAACYKKLGALYHKAGQQWPAIGAIEAGLSLSSELTTEERRLKSVLDKAMPILKSLGKF